MRTLLLAVLTFAPRVWSQTPSGDLTRILAGVEETGANSSHPAAKFFFDFSISRPLGQASASLDPLGSALRWWGVARIDSIPVQTSAPLSGLAPNLIRQAQSLTRSEERRVGKECRS